MADEKSTSVSKEKEKSSISNWSSKNDAQARNSVNVNVDYNSDRWMVVSYENENGDLFQGILLKANEVNDVASVRANGLASGIVPGQSVASRNRSTEKEETTTGTANLAQPILLLNGSVASTVPCSMLDPHKIPSVALRRTMSNGTNSDDSLLVANTKPALGIRRLENRAVRLRPTASQRNSVLCAKCQEQRVYLPPARRIPLNGNAERTRNGVGAFSSNHSDAAGVFSTKRRVSEIAESSTFSCSSGNGNCNKKTKVRSAGAVQAAAEAGHPITAALPSASIASSSFEHDGNSSAGKTNRDASSSGDTKASTPKIPKLKISFGNNEAKMTTIIALPQSYTDTDDDGANGDEQGGNKRNGHSIPPAAGPAGQTFDQSEGALLPGGLRVGDVVWAKMPSAPYWPAKIFSASETAACVTWCGSKQYGFVEFKAVEAFKDTFGKRYNAKRNNGSYQKAVAEAILKCSGDGEDDSSFCYQHLVSASCWKYLTGSKNAAARKRSSEKSGGRNKSRNGCRRLTTNKRQDWSMDGSDAQSVASFSSISSPPSNSTIDWQPKVNISAVDRVAVEKKMVDEIKVEPVEKEKVRKNVPVCKTPDRSVIKKRAAPLNSLGHSPVLVTEKPVQRNFPSVYKIPKLKPIVREPIATQKMEYDSLAGSVSPLPVERSEDDEDEDDDFKRLEIDEAAQLDDEMDESGCSSLPVCTNADDSAADASFSSVRTEVKREETETAVQGNRPRVGESQDDFESALTELQEMNEMCAGTSVLAQC